MRVLNDNVMVVVDKVKQNPNSMLYIPDSVQEGQVIFGTVTAVGDGKLLENGGRAQMSVKVGDTVWFLKFGAHAIETADKKQYVMQEVQILGVE